AVEEEPPRAFDQVPGLRAAGVRPGRGGADHGDLHALMFAGKGAANVSSLPSFPDLARLAANGRPGQRIHRRGAVALAARSLPAPSPPGERTYDIRDPCVPHRRE